MSSIPKDYIRCRLVDRNGVNRSSASSVQVICANINPNLPVNDGVDVEKLVSCSAVSDISDVSTAHPPSPEASQYSSPVSVLSFSSPSNLLMSPFWLDDTSGHTHQNPTTAIANTLSCFPSASSSEDGKCIVNDGISEDGCEEFKGVKIELETIKSCGEANLSLVHLDNVGSCSTSLCSQTEKEKDVKNLGPCEVCSDAATGYHYGVLSCEACKAFFKRTIQGNAEYRCQGNNECEVNRKRRKHCQACRMKKCLKIGMLVEGVRLNRVRGGRQKYCFNPITNKPEMVKPQKKAIDSGFKILNELLELEKNFVMPHSDVTLVRDEQSGMCPEVKLSLLTEHISLEIVDMTNWVKTITIFSKLPLDLKIELFQHAWSKLLLLWLFYRSCPFQGFIRVAKDINMRESDFTEINAAPVWNVFSRMTKAISDLKLSQEEYVLLKVIILFDTVLLEECSDEQRRELQEFKSIFLADLHKITSIQHRENPARIGEVLLLLPDLAETSVAVTSFWSRVRNNRVINFKSLFGEMLVSSSITP